MDIQHLIDRLEALIDEGRHLWFMRLTAIDEDRALELIDQMRISIPEEVDKAQRIMSQRDRVIAQANEEAARLVDLAREKSAAMIERDAITQAARSQAANIIEEARQEAEAVRAEADAYALDVLRRLEQQIHEDLRVVQNGIAELTRARTATVSTPPAAETEADAPTQGAASPDTSPA